MSRLEGVKGSKAGFWHRVIRVIRQFGGKGLASMSSLGAMLLTANPTSEGPFCFRGRNVGWRGKAITQLNRVHSLSGNTSSFQSPVLP